MGRPQFNPFRDVLSGAIMAATSIPQLIAYAETVGYPGFRGLSTAGPPLIAWGLATGSPYMNAGVTSITALMTKSDLKGDTYMAQHSEKEYVKLVAAYSLYVGFASLVLAWIGFGKLAKSVPSCIRQGFKWGCSVGVLVAAIPNGFLARGSQQLKELMATASASASSRASGFLSTTIIVPPQWAGTFPGAVTISQFLFILSHPWVWSFAPTVIFVLGTSFVLFGPRFFPNFLPPGTEVILLTVFATWYSVTYDYMGGIVGDIPILDPDLGIFLFQGKIRIPVEMLNVKELVTEVALVDQFGGSWFRLGLSAFLFAMVNFLSIMGIASGFESEDGIAWNAKQELIAQGISCTVAAAVGSAPVSGSLSRSLVSKLTGATSQFACIVTALIWVYLQPYMNIMKPTPKAALSAVIVSAVLNGVAQPKELMALRGVDAIVGWMTATVTALSSPTTGFMMGLVFYGLTFFLRSNPKPKNE